ncbi:MAG TPA: cyclic nucleotide-binding domain-containing protein, partial [Longimicrobiales bacterium]|nr:cyclic nucleotide-binding domain-containing protein [Longimicrobiales bacterium]
MSSRNLLVGPLLHLRTLHAFEGLSPRHLTALAQEVDEVYVERGTVLLSPSQPAQELHVVVDGLVSLRREGIEAPAGPGASVGFLELLAQGPSGTDARTQVDTVALRLDGDGLREVCERHFAILDALLANVARRAAEIPSALQAVVAGDPGAWTTPLALPLDRVARLRALHRAPAFPSASMDALSEMASHMKEVRLEAGEALWEVGTPAD